MPDGGCRRADRAVRRAGTASKPLRDVAAGNPLTHRADAPHRRDREDRRREPVRRSVIYVDSCVVIYAVERGDDLGDRARHALIGADSPWPRVRSSCSSRWSDRCATGTPTAAAHVERLRPVRDAVGRARRVSERSAPPGEAPGPGNIGRPFISPSRSTRDARACGRTTRASPRSRRSSRSTFSRRPDPHRAAPTSASTLRSPSGVPASGARSPASPRDGSRSAGR